MVFGLGNEAGVSNHSTKNRRRISRAASLTDGLKSIVNIFEPDIRVSKRIK